MFGPLSLNLYTSIRRCLWSKIAGVPTRWWLFTYCSVAIAKAQMYLLYKKYHRPKIPLNSILKQIKNRSDTCHILGNGCGALESVRAIKNDECVIAMNSGLFHEVRIDVYMAELHNSDDESLKGSQISIEENVRFFKSIHQILKRKNPNCLVLLKNMMYDNISPNVYDPEFSLITLPEVVYKFFPLGDNYIPFQKYLVDYILNRESDIVIQTGSSVTTAITLAYKAGFKKIYLHGVEAKGSHYFHGEALGEDLDCTEAEVLAYLRRLFPKVSPTVSHRAGNYTKRTLQFFMDIAIKKGVEIRII